MMTETENRRLVKVLWTGGMDSTFTMIKLSTSELDIQPIYLCDNRYRKSKKNEQNAIIGITEDIIKHPKTRCRILPLITRYTSEVEKDPSITQAFERLSEKTGLGSQYDWLARYAKSVDGLMMSLEKSENSKALYCITKYGEVERVKDGNLTYYVLNKDKSTDDLITVFGNLRFSLIWDYTKMEQVEEYKRLGYNDSLLKTWFCFTPINGKPCGTCNPCKTAIGDGMTWRFDPEALHRYKKANRLPLRLSNRILKALPCKKLIKKIYHQLTA